MKEFSGEAVKVKDMKYITNWYFFSFRRLKYLTNKKGTIPKVVSTKEQFLLNTKETNWWVN